MEPFRSHSGTIAVLNEDQVDTDRVIPARFLSRVSRSGYGELLFADVRGEDFALDRPEAVGTSVLVVGTNFGCGSSREHAVWAIQQAGFRAVIGRKTDDSAGFSDIFRTNAGNCGLLLVELAGDDHQALVEAGSGAEVSIDLEAQTVEVGERKAKFEIAPTTKRQLSAGLDLVGTTLEKSDDIAAFEERWSAFAPAR